MKSYKDWTVWSYRDPQERGSFKFFFFKVFISLFFCFINFLTGGPIVIIFYFNFTECSTNWRSWFQVLSETCSKVPSASRGTEKNSSHCTSNTQLLRSRQSRFFAANVSACPTQKKRNLSIKFLLLEALMNFEDFKMICNHDQPIGTIINDILIFPND